MIEQDLLRGNNNKRSSPCCLLKIDLQKAYDTVDWDFLLHLLAAYNFPSQFVSWICECVCKVNYSLVINGEPVGFLNARKGLRQGDPLSPLLFAIIMDYLSRSLILASCTTEYQFHPHCKQLKLCNLCFADDLLLFSKGYETSIQCLMTDFTEFSAVSGLQANMHKSTVYFGRVSTPVQQKILQCTEFQARSFALRYFGVPLSPKKWSKAECFNLIMKLSGKIDCWTSKKLSYARRLQLVRSTLNTLHNYWASIFMLQASILHDQKCCTYL